MLTSCYGPVRALLSLGTGQEAGSAAAAATRPSMSGIPNVRLDHRVAGDLRCRDSVTAVVDVEDVARPDQPYRRRLTSLLEPRSVELDLRPVEMTGTEADVCERDPCRCERRMCDTPPFSGRFEYGRVESNHHSHGRRGYSALSSPVLGVRRWYEAAGRIRTDTAGLTTPDARRYITAAKKWEAGLASRNRRQRRC